MVFERPKRPGNPASQPATNRPNSATQRTQPASSGKPKKIITTGGSGQGGGRNGNSGRGGGQGGNQRPDDYPSPWLEHPLDPQPSPDATASFVEYLRWMRSPDSPYKDPMKVQILQMAMEGANYQDRLTTLTNRTKLIAGEGNYFQAKAAWRIRVGGHRGPESVLLPAFDALGMPFIPSSTLRGVARNAAIQHFMATEGLDWKQADRKVAIYFGHLEANKPEDQCGKVVFLDAYPLPVPSGQQGGLVVDMANNIWKWDDKNQLDYSPNPNPFLSLRESTFLVGIRRASQCSQQEFDQIRQQVEGWLSSGLQEGIGSQVNIGYGQLVRAGVGKTVEPLLKVEFRVEGQLIHGQQRFVNLYAPFKRERDGSLKKDRNNNLVADTTPDAEVRSTAFKSMLRYWFRSFSLGVLQPDQVRLWEGKLFGTIQPKPIHGWIRVRVTDSQTIRSEPKKKEDDFGEQVGTLTLHFSPEAPSDQLSQAQKLLLNLTWMMFHLGGIGQGARRPCYSRQSRDYRPWWRGSNLIAESEDKFWQLPDTLKEFQQTFQQRLQAFYAALAQVTGISIDSRSPLTTKQVSPHAWAEAIDRNCRIVVCSGTENFQKPYALAILHDDRFKQSRKDKTGKEIKDSNGQVVRNYNPNLCGSTNTKPVKPSPVWIADLGNYQVITVFGTTQDPRQDYLKVLQKEATEYRQIFPLT